jgi:hypothetical protein
MVMSVARNYGPRFNRSLHEQFVDALRMTLGKEPLYHSLPRLPSPLAVEREFGTNHHPAGLVRAHTATDWHSRECSDDSGFRRKADGRRVGAIFRDAARRPGWRKRGSNWSRREP